MNKKIIDLKESIHEKKTEIRNAIAKKDLEMAEALKNEVMDLENQLIAEEKAFTGGKTGVANAKKSKGIFNHGEKAFKGNQEDLTVLGEAIYGAMTGKFTNAAAKKFYNENFNSGNSSIIVPESISGQFWEMVRDALTIPMRTLPVDTRITALPYEKEPVQVHYKEENDWIVPSDITLGARTMHICSAWGLSVFSEELFLDSTPHGIADLIIRSLAASYAQTIQKSALYGDTTPRFDAAGNLIAPIGLKNIPEVSRETYTTIENHDLIARGVSTVLQRNHNVTGAAMNHGTDLQFALTKAQDGQPLLQDRISFNTERHLTNACEGGDIFIGDFNELLLGVMGTGGFRIEISNQAGDTFKRGQRAVRLFGRHGIAVTKTDAFHILENGAALSEPAKAAKKK